MDAVLCALIHVNTGHEWSCTLWISVHLSKGFVVKNVLMNQVI